MSEDLKDRLMAVHLANASDTSRTIAEPEGAWDGVRGILKAVVYGVCCWVIITVAYLFLTSGG